MALLDWVPALSTTALLVMAGWLGRHLLMTRLKASVSHEFDEKLEKLRSQFRGSEERLKADLQAKEAEIGALRSGALTAMASRQVTVDKRRLQAIDQMWSAVSKLAPAKAVVSMMAPLKFEVAAERAVNEPRLQQLFESLSGGVDIAKLDQSAAHRARPFVTPMAWALYSALVAVVSQALLRATVLRSGVDPKGLLKKDTLPQLLKAVLPDFAGHIDQYGSLSDPFILEQLEAELLKELQKMAEGVASDQASVDRAAEILKRVTNLTPQNDDAE